MADLSRSLKIKTGVCLRLSKEVTSYQREAERDQQRLEQKRSEGRDEHDLKQLESVVAESRQMIVECSTRLRDAAADLDLVLAKAADGGSGVPAGEIEAAKGALAQANEHLAKAS